MSKPIMIQLEKRIVHLAQEEGAIRVPVPFSAALHRLAPLNLHLPLLPRNSHWVHLVIYTQSTGGQWSRALGPHALAIRSILKTESARRAAPVRASALGAIQKRSAQRFSAWCAVKKME